MYIKRKFIPRVIIVVMLFLLVIIGILVIIKYYKEKQEPDLSNNEILNNSNNTSNEHTYIISDIVYGNIYNNDFRVYVLEDGKYIPYFVIKTDNYGDNTVLLMMDKK